MTRLVVAYDAERLGACYPAAVRLVALHERLGIPATWFIVGELLEREPEWKALLRSGVEGGLFEVASHTWSHKLLRPSQTGDPQVSNAERWEELLFGKDAVEMAFGKACLGLRPPNGYPTPLDGDDWLIDLTWSMGFQYVSSQLWGEDYTPASWRAPSQFRTGMWEMPTNLWHDTAWLTPESLPIGGLGPPLNPTPWDVSSFYRLQFPEAERRGLPYLSFVWHPWCLAQLDCLEIAKSFAETLECSTFAAEYARVAQREEVAA